MTHRSAGSRTTCRPQCPGLKAGEFTKHSESVRVCETPCAPSRKPNHLSSTASDRLFQTLHDKCSCPPFSKPSPFCRKPNHLSSTVSRSSGGATGATSEAGAGGARSDAGGTRCKCTPTCSQQRTRIFAANERNQRSRRRRRQIRRRRHTLHNKIKARYRLLATTQAQRVRRALAMRGRRRHTRYRVHKIGIEEQLPEGCSLRIICCKGLACHVHVCTP